ncbi:MAG: MATE family efflux transporter [Acetatifactor sp.]|nr:MATE family efflux transporter [Acetatifactor sp.]
MNDAKKREERIRIITTGRLYPLLVRMAIPSMIGMIVSTVYNLTDTYFVGKLNDATLTASVGVVFSFVSVIQAIGFWFGYGSGNVISRMLGKKENDKAEEMAATGVVLAVVAGLVILILGLLFLKPVAVLMGAGGEEALLNATMRYLRITICTVPFMLLSNVIYNELRLAGSAKSSVIGLMVGMLLNMVLDPVLILWAGLGVEGAAYASMAGQITGLVILYGQTKKNGNVPVLRKKAKLDWTNVRTIMAGGAPNFCRQGISSISSVLINHVAGSFSVSAIAAVTIAIKVAYIAYALVIGFGQGFQPVCAMNYGAQKYDRIKKAFYMTLFTVTVFLLLTTGMLYVKGALFIRAFTGEEAVATLANRILRAQCVILPFMGYYVLIGMLLQNIGRFALATMVTTLENGFCMIPVLYATCALLGEAGLVWFKPISSGLALLISLGIGTHAWKKYLGKQSGETVK